MEHMTNERPAIEVDGISLRINGVSILSEVTFDVMEGEVVGLIGPNGAGKTSLINVLSGLMSPTRGTVTLVGNDVTRWKPHRRAVVGLGRTFQTSNLYAGLSVIESVRIAQQADRPQLRSGFRFTRIDGAADEKAHAILARVGLGGKAGVLAGDLSHGDKRKLELAMVMATGSKVLLLDEPMAGVNIDDIQGLIDLIGEIHEETKATILFVEHHMEVVMSLSHRIAVLHHGALLAIDEPGRIMSNETVQTAYIGDAL
jgi:branched-chain amino acid transport system ATP-binding protein